MDRTAFAVEQTFDERGGAEFCGAGRPESVTGGQLTATIRAPVGTPDAVSDPVLGTGV